MAGELIADQIRDSGLAQITKNASSARMDLCWIAPTTYVEATSTYSLASKLAPSIDAVANGAVDGRMVEINQVTDGNVNVTDTGNYWALTDTGTSTLWAAGPVNLPQKMTSGNTWQTDTGGTKITTRDATVT